MKRLEHGLFLAAMQTKPHAKDAKDAKGEARQDAPIQQVFSRPLRPWREAILFLLSVSLIVQAASPPPLNDPVEGQKLARELRETTPTEDASFKGVFRIFRPNAEQRVVPIQTIVSVGNKAWASTYIAHPTNTPAEELTISRSYGDPTNYYYLWKHDRGVEQPTGDFATNSFAGSDFALLDLGLEFFQWPTQVLVLREMTKGRGCDVLESRPARTNLYSRVVTWIDQDTRAQGTPGLLKAEAYDARGKLLKEFEINGLTKVGGRYQVKEMEIRNLQTKTRTRLVFDFDKH